MDILRFKYNDVVVEINLRKNPLGAKIDNNTEFWRNNLRQLMGEIKRRFAKLDK